MPIAIIPCTPGSGLFGISGRIRRSRPMIDSMVQWSRQMQTGSNSPSTQYSRGKHCGCQGKQRASRATAVAVRLTSPMAEGMARAHGNTRGETTPTARTTRHKAVPPRQQCLAPKTPPRVQHIEIRVIARQLRQTDPNPGPPAPKSMS